MPTPALPATRRALPAMAIAALACLTQLPAGLTGQTRPASVSPATTVTAPDTGRRKYSVADVAFVQGMIGHHAQALEMTALLPGRSTRADMSLLGERITVSQRDEIAMMTDWLRVRGETVPPVAATGESHGHHHMPGMLSVAQMDSLRSSKGPPFDQLFLRYMIQHHEGALVMVRELLASPGGAHEPQLYGFASDVDAEQRAEIDRMKRLIRK